MPVANIVIPEPKVEIDFSIDELDWLFKNPSWSTTIGPIVHPKTGQSKYIKITLEAKDAP